MSHERTVLHRAADRFHRWYTGLLADSMRRSFASCGERVSLQWPVVVNGAGGLRVGSDVSINSFVHIWAQGGVTIGDDTLIASHACITSLTHEAGAPRHSDTLLSKPVVIGKNVWIGAHAAILPGVTIGDGAVVGAGAIVTRDVAPGVTVVGVPAAPLPARRAT